MTRGQVVGLILLLVVVAGLVVMGYVLPPNLLGCLGACDHT